MKAKSYIIATGLSDAYSWLRRLMKAKSYIIAALLIAFLVVVTAVALAAEVEGENVGQQAVGQQIMTERAWGFISMTICISVPAAMAAISLSRVCSAAIGAIAEKPEIAGSTIIYVVFIEALAIYGLTVSFLIYTKL
ncbi:hypothetical protein KEJ27_00235 [Candidatus Bathyarchaeota archaeon]|nr:hypothetical protein [Candidatus Bathyarchaeota archaeon]